MTTKNNTKHQVYKNIRTFWVKCPGKFIILQRVYTKGNGNILTRYHSMRIKILSIIKIKEDSLVHHSNCSTNCSAINMHQN